MRSLYLSLSTIILLIFVLLWPTPYIYNNYKVSAFLKDLKNIKLPENAQIIDSYANFGILWGNSNHCDAEVAILIKTDLSAVEFEKIIREAKVKTPFSKEYHPLEIMFLEDNKLFSLDYGISKEIETRYNSEKSDINILIDYIKEYAVNEEMNYFLVSTWDQTYSGYSMNDLRCN